MTDDERRFLSFVKRILGEPEAIERTPRGRTVIRYPEGVTVSGDRAHPIAARRCSDGRLRFAVVRDGGLRWSANRPEKHYKPPKATSFAVR